MSTVRLSAVNAGRLEDRAGVTTVTSRTAGRTRGVTRVTPSRVTFTPAARARLIAEIGRLADGRESGGFLFGSVDADTINVSAVIEDSGYRSASAVQLVLGRGLEIARRNGLDLIGDWHAHPPGAPCEASDDDRAAWEGCRRLVKPEIFVGLIAARAGNGLVLGGWVTNENDCRRATVDDDMEIDGSALDWLASITGVDAGKVAEQERDVEYAAQRALKARVARAEATARSVRNARRQANELGHLLSWLSGQGNSHMRAQAASVYEQRLATLRAEKEFRAELAELLLHDRELIAQVLAAAGVVGGPPSILGGSGLRDN